MLIADTFTVEAPIETVWSFFFDLDRMRQSVPGVESIDRLDDRTYRGRIRVKVGAISASFGGLATITELEPPTRMTAQLQGEDKTVASFVQGTFRSSLRPVEAGTEVSYQMDVNLRGRLAQFGTAVVNATAKKMTAEFTGRLRTMLADERPAPVPGSSPSPEASLGDGQGS